jgi:serine/threonine-protein kinase
MLICIAPQSDGTVCGTGNANGMQHCQTCGASLRRALEIHDPGTTIGTYRIVKVIGFGGFGAVYEADDAQQSRRVALKETFDPNNIRGFRSEFGVLQHLNHTNLPHYYDMFEAQGNGYLVMELVRGQSLEDVLQYQQQALPESQVLGYALQMCDALIYLHGQKPAILHRDIKPANIRLTPEGLIKLVDFGLLKRGTQTTRVTIRGAGTPEYAPVEQYGGAEHTDARSDVYSLGATLYHLLTNTVPLPAGVRISKTPDPLAPPQKLVPALSPTVAQAVVTAMSLMQHDRYPTVAAFKQALMGAPSVYAQSTVQVAPAHQPAALHAQQTHRANPSPQPRVASPPQPQRHAAAAPQSAGQHTIPLTGATSAAAAWWDGAWWVQWLIVTAVGWALGSGLATWLLAAAIGWPIFGAIYDILYAASGTAAYHLLSGLIGGTVVGAAQWLLLRRRLPNALGWIAASAIGWAIGWAVGGIVAVAAFYQIIIGAVGGACAGIAQWQVLQRHVPDSFWWIVASATGWAAGWAVSDGLFGLGHGAVAGALTGVLLLWLLRHTSSNS